MREHRYEFEIPHSTARVWALFLCSDACRFLTGHTLEVDGGAFLHA